MRLASALDCTSRNQLHMPDGTQNGEVGVSSPRGAIAAVLEELLQIDEALARGTGDDYRAGLTDDAVVLLPGMGLLDRETCAVAVNSDPGPAGARSRCPTPGS